MLRIGLHKSSGLGSKLIQWQTRSEYSHASLILPDYTLLESLQGKGVVQMRKLQQVKEPVDVFDVVAMKSIHDAALEFALAQLGKQYDWTMIARFVTRRDADRATSNKWFCSELVFAAFMEGGLPLLRATEPWEVSPGLLSKSPYLILCEQWPGLAGKKA